MKKEEKRILRRGASLLHGAPFEAVQPHLPILASASHAAVAQPNACHRTRMTREAALTLARARLPDLGHGVIGTGDNTQSVPDETPDALDVTKHAPQADSGRRVPETNRVVESAREHVSRW